MFWSKFFRLLHIPSYPHLSLLLVLAAFLKARGCGDRRRCGDESRLCVKKGFHVYMARSG